MDTALPVRILIVDDHPNTATMLARVLSKFETPVEVLTAAGGEDALKKIGDRGVDILITDFMMPGMNGLELIEKVRQRQTGAQLPRLPYVILITAYDTAGLAITARRLSVQDYLVKPVQPEKIRSIVSKVLDELRPADPVPITPSKNPFKILVADDYPDNLRLLSARLQGEGYIFIPAWDGEDTLNKVRSEMPDLVLLDVNMPRKDGFQVLAEIRADPAVAHIPVIMVTAARIGPKDVREGLALGADDYVIKPFDWRELAARIQSKLRVKQAEDALRRRMKELGILPEIGQELSTQTDLDELAGVILNRVVETLGADSAWLDIFNQDGNTTTHIRWASALTTEKINQTREAVMDQGLTAVVVPAQQGLVVENVAVDSRWRPPRLVSRRNSHGGSISAESQLEAQLSAPSNVRIGSAVSVPLLGRHDVIGVLTLLHNETGFFTLDHQTLLQAVASQAAIAIENAHLFSMEHRRVQELTALNHINRELLSFSYSRQLLENLPRLVQHELGFHTVTVWENCGNGSDELKLAAMAGGVQEIDPDVLVAYPQQAFTQQAPLAISSPEVTPSVIAAPLLSGQKICGVLAVYDPASNCYNESERVLVETLATQVTSALERIGSFESVEQEQRRLLAVLRSAADAILVLDTQGQLTLANPAGERLLNGNDRTVEEDREDNRMPSFRLLPGRGYDEFILVAENAREAGVQQQHEVAWPDGRTFSVLVTPIEEGGQVAVLHDVTHFKALAELKNEYIATASHDLKNPIMGIIGYADLLSKAGPLTEMQQEFARRIQSSAMQMRDLVLNLLEVSRLESGTGLRLDELDLSVCMGEWLHELSYQAKAKNHQLDLVMPSTRPIVLGDRILLQQMVYNLLGNAIKYTPPGGKIQVSLAQAGDQVRLVFQDNGIGIPAEAMPKLFTKFFRVQDDATRDIEGTGLGLAIVKSIVDSHAGQVSVESEAGKGSMFAVVLPALRFEA